MMDIRHFINPNYRIINLEIQSGRCKNERIEDIPNHLAHGVSEKLDDSDDSNVIHFPFALMRRFEDALYGRGE